VYGHSPNDLYKLNPLTKQVSVVGPFKNIAGAVIDIAINDKHEIYATTFEGLYTVDKQTATATLIKQGNYPNSLSFVPVGVLDPTEEVLVGYKNSTYIRISTVTGDIVTVGNLGGGLISSGDIVSVKDGVTLLTAKGSNCGDCLVEVDPKTGAMVKNHGDIGFSSVFGLAYWGGSAYGFSATGSLFEVSFGNGPVSSKVIPVPGAPADLKFWGAGSSTIAPVNPPK
jgi:hypothetical protein